MSSTAALASPGAPSPLGPSFLKQGPGTAWDWRQQARVAEARALRFGDATTEQRDNAARMLTLTGFGWVLLVSRRWPESGAVGGTALVIGVGPPGVFVVDANGASETDSLLRVTDTVEDAVAGEHIAPAVVSAVSIVAQRSTDTRSGRVWSCRDTYLVPALAGLPTRLTPETVRAVAWRFGAALPGYVEVVQDGNHHAPPGGAPGSDPEALFDAEHAAEAHLGADATAIEPWMSMLHPDQLSLVRRQFGGPARISGAPARQDGGRPAPRRVPCPAQCGPGPFVSPVRTLAHVQAKLLSDSSAPRRPGGIHRPAGVGGAAAPGARAGRELQRRGGVLPASLGSGRPVAGATEPDIGYWRDEISYVIKGRGVADVDAYLELPRPGRRVPLKRAHRQAVWSLYAEYERLKQELGIRDPADILLDALDEVRRRHVTGYSSVIVDEVQDLSLTGVKLVHALVGDAPNGLLLIGDGSSRSIRSGSTSLKPASPSGAPEPRRCAATTATARPSSMPRSRSPRKTLSMTSTAAPCGATHGRVNDPRRPGRERGDPHRSRPRPGVAGHHRRPRGGHEGRPDRSGRPCRGLLCRTLFAAAERGRRRHPEPGRLRRTPTPALKIGTIRRCKGLEFTVVLLPRFDEAAAEAKTGGMAEEDRLALANRQLYVAMTRARELLWLGQVRRVSALARRP